MDREDSVAASRDQDARPQTGTTGSANRLDDLARDARRYRRLRVLGCAPCDTPQLDHGTVLRFQSLDAIVDEDIRANPSRGEAEKLPAPDGGGFEPQCGYCAARYWTAWELAEHVRRAHGGPKPTTSGPPTEDGSHPAGEPREDAQRRATPDLPPGDA